jgi:FdrA protein
MHVMLFSNNVPLQTEVELKTRARDKGLLLMGPDCGTAIINGVPLGFANAVRRGEIGIVAAAGTGLQEVSCLISNAGAGISQAIGTGGRDVKKQVGGIMFVEALRALATDENTRVILLVAKPPDAEVLERIAGEIRDIKKPVVPMFVGAATWTLEQAALTAVAIARGEDPMGVVEQLAARDAEIRARAAAERTHRKPGQKFVRGLFSGGTFCAEAQVLLAELPGGVYSNAPAGTARKLADALKSAANTIIDLGEDEFTVGRPHPMIDYTLRNRRIVPEAADPETAVVLLDVILGYGAHPDPAGELEQVLREARRSVAVVCSVTGTDQDPQDRSEVARRLEASGAVVMPSNAAACKLAGYIGEAMAKPAAAAKAEE